jgi:hypothetical protein
MKKFFSNPLVANLVILVLLICAAFLVYHPSYLNPNLFWDDERFIFMSPEVLNAKSWLAFWDRGSQFFRSWPLGYAFFWSLVKFSPLQSVAFYKTLNIIFHGLSTFLLYHVFKKLKLIHPLFLSLFFLVHPLQVEAVSWIFQLLLILSFAFFIGSVWCLFDFLEKRKISILVLGFILFVASLWTKSAALLAPFFFVYLFWVNNQKFKTYLLLVPFFLASLLIGLDNVEGTKTFFGKSVQQKTLSVPDKKMIAAQNEFNAVYRRELISFPENQYVFSRSEVFTQGTLHYFSKIIIPVNLQFIYQKVGVAFIVPLLICLLAFGLPGYFYYKTKNRYVLAIPVLLITFLLPYLGLNQISFFYWSNVSDRYCYYVLVAYPLLIATLLKWKDSKLTRRILMVWLFGLIVMNFSYGIKFNRPKELYTEIIEYKPHPVIYKLLFDQYMQKVDPVKAEGILNEALIKFPNDPFLIDGKKQLENFKKNF